MRFLGQAPALGFVSEPEQVFRELRASGNVIRIEGQRAPLTGRAFGEAIFLRKVLSEEIIDFGIRLPEFQRGFARGFFAFGIAAQMRQDRAIDPRFGLPWIHLEGPLQQFLRIFIVLAGDQVPCEQQQCAHVVRVLLQRFVHVLKHLFAVAGLKRFREAEVHVRIVGKFFQAGAKLFGGQIEIMFVQRELAHREIHAPMIGVRLARRLEDIIQDFARVGAEEQNGLADGDHRRSVANAAVGARTDQGFDFPQNIGGAIRVAGEWEHFMREQPQWNAPRVTFEGVRDDSACLGIFADGDQ